MRALILAAAVAVLAGTAAIAQQSPQQPMMDGQMAGAMMEYGGMGHMMMGQGMMGQAMMDQGGMPMMGMNPSRHIEGRLAFLKTELKITEAQAAPWNADADAVRANAKRMGELMDQMAAHMEMLAAIKEPATQLYGALSDDQKRLADQLIGPMGMM